MAVQTFILYYLHWLQGSNLDNFLTNQSKVIWSISAILYLRQFKTIRLFIDSKVIGKNCANSMQRKEGIFGTFWQCVKAKAVSNAGYTMHTKRGTVAEQLQSTCHWRWRIKARLYVISFKLFVHPAANRNTPLFRAVVGDGGEERGVVPHPSYTISRTTWLSYSRLLTHPLSNGQTWPFLYHHNCFAHSPYAMAIGRSPQIGSFLCLYVRVYAMHSINE